MRTGEWRPLEHHKNALHALKRKWAYEDKLAEHDALDNFAIRVRYERKKGWGVWIVAIR